jgi:hypothetical protein
MGLINCFVASLIIIFYNYGRSYSLYLYLPTNRVKGIVRVIVCVVQFARLYKLTSAQH